MTLKSLWIISSEITIFRGYGLCHLFECSPSHVWAKIWFWCPFESRCTTHNFYALPSAQHALATETLPPKLAEVLTIVIECVNYVRNSALKHRIFKELCNEMDFEFEVLLYYSNVWWLFRGKVLNRVIALRVELAVFCESTNTVISGVQRSGDARGQLLDCMPSFQTVKYSIMCQRQTLEIHKS